MSAFCASFRTTFVFASQRAPGPQYASARSSQRSYALPGLHSVALAGSIGEGGAGGCQPPGGIAAGAGGRSSQILSCTAWYASLTSGSSAYCAFMSASDILFLRASRTSQGAL